MGTGIAIGIDAINYWVNNTESGKNFTNNTSDWLGKAWTWMKDLSKYIWDGILAGYKWLEDILGKPGKVLNLSLMILLIGIKTHLKLSVRN